MWLLNIITKYKLLFTSYLFYISFSLMSRPSVKKIGLSLSKRLQKRFVSVKVWYPLKETIGSEFFHARKRYSQLYNFYDDFK